MTQVVLRPFAAADYGRLVEIDRLTWPDRAVPEADWRRRDGRFDHERYFRVRYIAELDGQMVGWGQIGHMPWQFYPNKYRLDLVVDPAWRRCGVGSALYDRLLSEVRPRGAEVVRASATEAMPASLAFLAQRGFRERSRSWESHLDVTTFDFDRFPDAEARAQREGVIIENWADVQRQGEAVWRAVY